MFTRTLLQALLQSFKGVLIFAHLGAAVTTFIFVVTGFDWKYFVFVNEMVPRFLLFAADAVGFIVPVFLPVSFLLFGWLRHAPQYTRVGLLLCKSVLLAFAVSMMYKMFTGRISPPHHGPYDVDISSAFQFGFMEQSLIGGWPSSHATVMCALAITLVLLFPKSKVLHFAVYAVALFVGLGVTFGFHWFSEFFAGALIGTALGYAVVVTDLKLSAATKQK